MSFYFNLLNLSKFILRQADNQTLGSVQKFIASKKEMREPIK